MFRNVWGRTRVRSSVATVPGQPQVSEVLFVCIWLHVLWQEGLELRTQLHVTAAGIRRCTSALCRLG